MAKEIIKLASGDWWFEWDCGVCMDSGVVIGLLGPAPCDQCQASLGSVAERLYGALSLLHLQGKKINDAMFVTARLLVSATVDAPILGEALADRIGAVGDQNERLRYVKHVARRLRNDWHLPVCGRREQPFGYFFAATPGEFLDWMRTTRSQAISELATAYHLFKSAYPDLAGQQSLDFVDTVSTELQEAIR